MRSIRKIKFRVGRDSKDVEQVVNEMLHPFARDQKVAKDIDDAISDIMNMIDIVNNLSEHVDYYSGVDVNNLEIPDFLSFMVIPKRVCLLDTVKGNDLLEFVRDSESPSQEINPNRMKQAICKLENILRRGITTKKIGELRNPVLLNDFKYGIYEYTTDDSVQDAAPYQIVDRVLVVNENVDVISNFPLPIKGVVKEVIGTRSFVPLNAEDLVFGLGERIYNSLKSSN